jgi:hypothetical protein
VLSSHVYVNTEPRSAELHPRRATSHSHARSNSLFFSPAFNDSTDQHPNAIQSPPKACHTGSVLSRQHRAPLSPLPAILMDHPASVANKRLTKNLTPLDATLTKNRGEGCTQSFTPFRQIPTTSVFSATYKWPIFYPLYFDIHPRSRRSDVPTFRRGDALCGVQQLCDTLCPWEFCGGSHAGWEHRTT